MYMLDLEKAIEPEIKLSTRDQIGSKKSEENFFKKTNFASLAMLKSLTVLITTNWKILKVIEIPDRNPCLLRNRKQVKKQ